MKSTALERSRVWQHSCESSNWAWNADEACTFNTLHRSQRIDEDFCGTLLCTQRLKPHSSGQQKLDTQQVVVWMSMKIHPSSTKRSVKTWKWQNKWQCSWSSEVDAWIHSLATQFLVHLFHVNDIFGLRSENREFLVIYSTCAGWSLVIRTMQAWKENADDNEQWRGHWTPNSRLALAYYLLLCPSCGQFFSLCGKV